MRHACIAEKHQGKSELCLYLILPHIMKMYCTVDVYFRTFLTTAVDRGMWSASCSGCSTPEEGTPNALQDRKLDRPQSHNGYYGKKSLSTARN